jgi:hypothetical protein
MDGILFKAFGHLFRLMMNIKENYLGSYHHYTTHEGFIAAFKKGIVGEHPNEVNYHAASSNTFEMDLQATITDLLLAFPQGQYLVSIIFMRVPYNHTNSLMRKFNLCRSV